MTSSKVSDDLPSKADQEWELNPSSPPRATVEDSNTVDLMTVMEDLGIPDLVSISAGPVIKPQVLDLVSILEERKPLNCFYDHIEQHFKINRDAQVEVRLTEKARMPQYLKISWHFTAPKNEGDNVVHCGDAKHGEEGRCPFTVYMHDSKKGIHYTGDRSVDTNLHWVWTIDLTKVPNGLKSLKLQFHCNSTCLRGKDKRQHIKIETDQFIQTQPIQVQNQIRSSKKRKNSNNIQPPIPAKEIKVEVVDFSVETEERFQQFIQTLTIQQKACLMQFAMSMQMPAQQL